MGNTRDPLNTAAGFPGLPRELRDMIWEYAAKEAENSFRRLYPAYVRYWHMEHKPPYVNFHVYELPYTILDAVRRLFGPLLLANKESREIASRYVSVVYQRKMEPKVALNFGDKFVMSAYTALHMVLSSSLSDDHLRSQTDATSFKFPPLLDIPYKKQLDSLSSAMNLTVPGSLFANSKPSWACRELLLRFRWLRVMYIDLTRRRYEPLVQPPEWRRAFSDDNLNAKHFIELSEFRDGKFELKWPDEASFAAALYAQVTDVPGLYIKRNFHSPGDSPVEMAWESQQVWKENYMDVFSRNVRPFVEKGIKCVLVYHFGAHGYTMY